MKASLCVGLCVALLNPAMGRAAVSSPSKVKSSEPQSASPSDGDASTEKKGEAAPPKSAKKGDAPSTTQADLEQARKLYYEGETRFELHDYQGAIDKWTEAYGSLPDNEQTARHKNDLAYNIALAHIRVYDIDNDVAHLRLAQRLLTEYVERFKEIHDPTDDNKHDYAEAKGQLQQLEQKIAAATAGGQSASPPEQPPPNPAVDRRRQYKLLLSDDPEYRSGRGMTVGGAVLVGVGGPILIISLSLIPAADGVVGPAIGSAVGGALAVSGIALLGVGVPRMKRAKRRAWEQSGVDVGLLPTGPTANSFGVSIVGRF
jgi:hypothetical protein